MSELIIDRNRVKNEFAKYVANYDAEDPKIALKIKHTYKVSELCDEIAKSLDLSPEDIDIAWLLGMLHDIGRFEQCRIYNTFIDAESVSHAEFGCKLLFEDEKLIERFIDDKSLYQVIHDAIFYHSVFRIPEDMDERTAMFANILRDADKIDIIRANNETPLADIYNSTEEIIRTASITKQVMDCFYEHHAVYRKLKKTPVDNVVGHVSMMFELVYKRSRQLAKELGYIDQMLEFKTDNEDTRQKFLLMKEEIQKFFSENT